mmetsp:Transcript_37425/g.116989  ORF Transcript_37425/g.116989 Transcript_37425/m.116989 type:complete len:200 (-) Transcript_37425:1495-2094(-)
MEEKAYHRLVQGGVLDDRNVLEAHLQRREDDGAQLRVRWQFLDDHKINAIDVAVAVLELELQQLALGVAGFKHGPGRVAAGALRGVVRLDIAILGDGAHLDVVADAHGLAEAHEHGLRAALADALHLEDVRVQPQVAVEAEPPRVAVRGAAAPLVVHALELHAHADGQGAVARAAVPGPERVIHRRSQVRVARVHLEVR